MTVPGGGVNVQITGSMDGLDETLDRAAAKVQTTTEKMGSAFEGMQHRFEHSGVLIAFAVTQMADGQELGVTRALHSIALLGFAFGPVVGAITTGAALALDAIHDFVTKSEKEVAEFQKKMEDLVNGAKIEELLKEREKLLTGEPMKAGKLVPPSDLVTGAFKGSIEDLEAEAAKAKKNIDAFGSGFSAWFKVPKELTEAREKLKELDADIAAAQAQQGRLGQSGALPKVTISVDSDQHAAEKAKEANAKKLSLALALQSATDKIDAEGAKQSEKELDDQIAAQQRATEKRLAINDGANRQAYDLAVAATKQLGDVRAAGAKDLAADAKAQAEGVAKEWTKAFDAMDSAVVSAYDKVKKSGGGAADYLRAVGQNLLRSEVENEAHILEAKLVRILAGQTADEAAQEKSLILSAASAVAHIANEAAKAAASVWASMSEGGWVGFLIGAGVAAAASAAVMGLASSVRSAAGGFDVPSGLNPVTQLHSQEMVLPAHLANAVRSMAGASGSSSGEMHFHFHTNDSVTTEAWARRNADVLGRAALSHVQQGGRKT